MQEAIPLGFSHHLASDVALLIKLLVLLQPVYAIVLNVQRPPVVTRGARSEASGVS